MFVYEPRKLPRVRSPDEMLRRLESATEREAGTEAEQKRS
jgi:hypothetical protein